LGFVRALGWLWPREIFSNFFYENEAWPDLGKRDYAKKKLSAMPKNTTSSNPKSL